MTHDQLATSPSLQLHHSAEVVGQGSGILEDSRLVLDPRHRLLAVDSERLQTMRSLKLRPLLIDHVAQLSPSESID